MNTKRSTMGAAMVLVMAIAIGSAEAGNIPLKGSFSGTSVSLASDTNGDGLKASLAIVGFKSTQGSGTEQAVSELQNPNAPDPPSPCLLPSGEPGLELTLLPGTGREVARFDSTGDLLFREITSETLCIDSTTFTTFSFSETAIITGGTGKYEGATGSNTFEGTGKVLDPAGTGLSELSGTFTGTIILP